MAKGIDGEGHLFHGLEIRFENKPDMDELFEFIRDKIDRVPVLKGTVSKHNCPHDEGTPQSCKIDEEYNK